MSNHKKLCAPQFSAFNQSAMSPDSTLTAPPTTRRAFLKTSAAAIGLLALPSFSQAALPEPSHSSWPSFRNGNELRGIAGSALPEKLELLWKIEVDDGVTATAAIVGDHVYAGTYGGELICLDRKTGKRLWTHFSAEKKKPTDFIPGFQSSPTVFEDLVLAGDEDGVFHAVDRESGKLRWKYVTLGEIIASAAIFQHEKIKDRIIVGSYDATLYCLKLDGSLDWKFETQDRINGSPAIAGDITFVTGCDQHLRAVNILTGKEEFDMPLERFLIASPTIDKDTLYVGTHEGEFLAIDLARQEVIWRHKDPSREQPIHSSAALTDKFVIFGGQDKQLQCLDRKTGERQWAFQARGQINSSPVVVGERIFVGSNDGNLYEVGLADGQQRWKTKLGRSVTASPAVGEGCLVIGAEGASGEIYCFGAK